MLADDFGLYINAWFWGENQKIDDLNQLREENPREIYIISIKEVKINIFNDNKSLSCSCNTQIEINPETKRVKTLREWYQVRANKCSLISINDYLSGNKQKGQFSPDKATWYNPIPISEVVAYSTSLCQTNENYLPDTEKKVE